MNKTELIEKIAAGADLSKADAKKALDATVKAIKDALADGDKIALVGFGTFSVSERPAREGINPATKEKIQIAAKKVVKFKAGAELAVAQPVAKRSRPASQPPAAEPVHRLRRPARDRRSVSQELADALN